MDVDIPRNLNATPKSSPSDIRFLVTSKNGHSKCHDHMMSLVILPEWDFCINECQIDQKSESPYNFSFQLIGFAPLFKIPILLTIEKTT